MDVCIYETPDGLIADFRPYLDGVDHSHEPARDLGGYDPRWEKVQNLTCPRTNRSLFGKAKFVGRASLADYHELMIFPVAFEGEYEPDGAPAEEAGDAAGEEAEVSPSSSEDS